MTPEAEARTQIDALLSACGWLIQDYKSLNLGAGKGIAVREVPLKHGRCDYLLIENRLRGDQHAARFRLEHKARLLQFIEEGAVDATRFQQILERHGLVERWQQFQRQFLET